MAPKIIDKAERRRAILRAATAVFARRGFGATTMDDVAEAAGLAKGTLYLYFDSKEALFFALFEAFAEDAMAEGMPDISAMSPVDAVEAILLAIGARIDADTVLVPLTLEFWSAAGVERTREVFGARYGQMLDAFRSQMVAMLSAAPGAEGLPLAAIASNLLALIDGLIVQRWVDPDMSVEATLRAALPILLAGLRHGRIDRA